MLTTIVPALTTALAAIGVSAPKVGQSEIIVLGGLYIVEDGGEWSLCMGEDGDDVLTTRNRHELLMRVVAEAAMELANNALMSEVEEPEAEELVDDGVRFLYAVEEGEGGTYDYAASDRAYDVYRETGRRI